MPPPDSHIPPATVTLPINELTLLADVLSELDAFLRSPAHHDVVFAALRAHAAESGGADAGYLIDAVQLSALHFRRLIAKIDEAVDAATIREATGGDD